MTRKGGWFGESQRHSLASRGIETGQKQTRRGRTPSPRMTRAEHRARTAIPRIYDLLWEHASPAYNREQDKEKWRKNFFYFQNVPASFGRKLLSEYPNIIDPEMRQNESPKMREMVEMVEKYNGSLIGYAIPPESGRDDSRVTFDGFIIKTDMATAHKLKKQLKPDEFDPRDDGYRFWWD